MKIIITLPDWVDEREINILAGLERVAYKNPNESWKVKIVRCSQCGKCCMDVPENHFYQRAENGNCVNLIFKEDIQKYACKLSEYKPFACCVGDQTIPECIIAYEEQ